MATYVKMTNGPVNVLVDVKNKNCIQDRLNDGFRVELDKNGKAVLIDSNELVSSENNAVQEVLDLIKAKQSEINNKQKEDVPDIENVGE